MSQKEAAETGCYSATAAGHRCYMVLHGVTWCYSLHAAELANSLENPGHVAAASNTIRLRCQHLPASKPRAFSTKD